MVIASRGGGLRPHRHDGTSPLPAYTTLAPAFSPNVLRNENEGPKTKRDSLEHFLRINLRREGPKAKSGSLEHFLRIDLRGGGAEDQEWLLQTLSTNRPKRGREGGVGVVCESISPTQGATRRALRVHCRSFL